MFKHNNSCLSSNNENTFIRSALVNNLIRLDGRGNFDFRGIDIQLIRDENSSTCRLQLGFFMLYYNFVCRTDFANYILIRYLYRKYKCNYCC